MAIININNLSNIREELRDKRIVFCSGTFDLAHAGHILFFEDCKKLGDILVVGIGADSITKKRKGDKRPVFNEHVRIKTVDSFKPVDYTLMDNISNENNKLMFLDVVFEKLKPDIYVINDDAFDISYRKELCTKFGVELKILKRWCPKEFDEISTSKIIEKIKDFD